MKKPSISPVLLLNWSLYVLVLLLIGGIAFGAFATHQKLSSFVREVDHLKIDSELSEQSIANAQKLQRTLDDNKDSVARAAAIVADTKYYEYQDQIVKDISSYAAASNLTVLGFDFTTTAAKSTSNIKGLKTIIATISLKSPVPYNNYLRFLKLVEKNLTKMQVTQLDISNDLANPGAVSSPIVTLEVYVR